MRREPCNIIRRNSPLLVGGTSQGDEAMLFGNKMVNFDRIAHGVNIGISCAHGRINQNSPGGTQGERGVTSQRGLGTNTNRRNAQIKIYNRARLERGLMGVQARNSIAQIKSDPFTPQLGVNDIGHLHVERCHDLR